ncbi:ralBP1-associated Eps domain-containing protein 1 [Anopheles marshallii]|uniref:ralBP1-associated Eps domain-containing protein 1 n=1 Tax=Anopheles marshallii TaxID=1521116 RepID=UPI00237A0D8D|nr:ralBP1-associated Eps domain-containing protein 1 [Anopheles marshallii]
MDELSEAELRYYNDLFKICSETDGAGKIPALKATSLFRSANLSNETINKITALAGIPQTALHLSRQQFYGCLKLIAAFQAAVPLREEILTTSVNLPLPQFSWIDPVTGPSGAADSSAIISSVSSSAAASGGVGNQTGSLERNGYTEVNNRSTIKVTGGAGSSGGGAGSSTTQDSSASTGGEMTNSDQPSTDSEVEHTDDPVNMIRGERERHTVGMLKGGGIVMIGSSHPLVGGGGGGGHGGGGGSPEAWSTASDSPTPTNSVAERPWANQNLWQGLVCEEQRQLLGTEEESSDRHSSDEDEQEIDLEYFYQISQTQKEYYLKQFRTIQPDVHGLVTGPVARVFFEKSRIPIDELRHIWQMCDVTRDGALNLAEFTAAMHLVVLRRNNIPVPATLPPCLLPSLLQHSLLQPSGGSGGTSGTAGVSVSGVSGELSSVVGGGSGSTTIAQVSNERTEPAEADLLHLESDDNVESSGRKRFDAHKDYQRMVPVPDSLAFARVASTGSNVNAGVAHDTSPTSVSSATGVGSSSGTTGSASVANATKGSSSGSNSSSTAVSTTGGRKTPPNVSPPVLAQHQQQHVTASAQKVKQPADHPVTPPNSKTTNKEWNSTTKEWTKFMESPTSNVSSPGPKPVNFDLQRTTQAIVSNPHIVHPVPLRVTPVGAETVDNGSLVYGSDLPVGTGGLMVVQSMDDSSPKQQPSQQQQAQSHHHSTPRDSLTNSGDLRAIQRPQPKKPPSKGVGAIPPPPQRDSGAHPSSSHTGNNDSMTISLDASGFAASSTGTATNTSTTTTDRLPSLAKKQSVDQQQPPPPLPPPRPSAHRHTRSSSLDLNKLKLTTNNAANVAPIGDPLKMPPPPEVPPRVTPTGEAPSNQSQRQAHGFADFTHFPSGASGATTGHRIGSMGDSNNITTIHLDAAGNMTHHSTPRGSGTLPKSLVMHQPRNSAFEVYRKPHTEGRLTARGSQSPPQQQQQPPLVTSRSVESSGVVCGDYEKRISALSDSLRQVRFKANDPPPVMPDVLKQLKEQNLLLLRICNDLSEELLHIQQKREDIRIKIELQEQILGGGGSGSGVLFTGPSSLPAVSSSSSACHTHHHSHHHANL